MKKIVFLIILGVIMSCKSNDKNETLLKKENELLRREIELQKKEKELLKQNNVNHKVNTTKKKSKKVEVATLIKRLSNLLGETLVKIDTYGNIKYDSGTASNGRFSGNLKNVTLNLQYNKNSDCDGCPSQGVLASILFKCKNKKKCLDDMGFKQNSSLISFSNKEKAKKTYNLLIQIQNNL